MIIEDGSIVTNADSYISVADAQTFIDARGLSVTITEGLLYQAMDSLNTLDYKGFRTDASLQALPFPRSGIYLSDNRLLPSDEIPQELIDAQCWLAYYIDSGYSPSAIATQQVIKEKVDVLEIQYSEGQSISSYSVYNLPNVQNLLKYLITAEYGFIDRA